MRLSEVKEKEVINMNNCKKLGYVSDLEIDICNGCIKEIILPGKRILCKLFSNDSEIHIRFCQIKQIGPDVILVDLDK